MTPLKGHTAEGDDEILLQSPPPCKLCAMALARRRARAWLYVARAGGRTQTIPVTFAQRASVGSTEVAGEQLHRSLPFCTFFIHDP